MRSIGRWMRMCVALLMCLSLCSCDLNALLQDPAESLSSTSVKADVPIVLLENGYAYDMLSFSQQENYKTLVKRLYESRERETTVLFKKEYGLTVVLPYAIKTDEEAKQLFRAVFYDHPEFFYLKYYYTWRQLVDLKIIFDFYYVWGVEERAEKAVELEKTVSALVEQVREKPPVEQELYFHDTLTHRNEYYREAASNGEEADALYYEAATPYAALCAGKPICVGYSRAFQLLLSRVGIRNTTVYSETHEWTMVWLDGEPYHTDVTWDDPVGGEEVHHFFNVTEEDILATHEPIEQWIRLPSSTATTYNYYRMNGWYIEDVYSDTLGEVIRTQIESGSTTIHLKVDPDQYDNTLKRLCEENAFFEAVSLPQEEALRDRWCQGVSYSGVKEVGIIDIHLGKGK